MSDRANGDAHAHHPSCTRLEGEGAVVEEEEEVRSLVVLLTRGLREQVGVEEEEVLGSLAVPHGRLVSEQQCVVC